MYNNIIYNVIMSITVSLSIQVTKNGNSECHMSPVRDQKWYVSEILNVHMNEIYNKLTAIT